MSAKEKVEIFSNWARRRFAPMPWEAQAAHLLDRVPETRERRASSTMYTPERMMTLMSMYLMPTSMMLAICRGMRSSHTVSTMTMTGERTAYFPYPLK